MSTKLLHFSPQPSTRVIRVWAIPEHWIEWSGAKRDISFLRSWLERDGEPDQVKSERRFNWGAIAGLVLSVTISGGFWVGVGLLVQRLWT